MKENSVVLPEKHKNNYLDSFYKKDELFGILFECLFELDVPFSNIRTMKTDDVEISLKIDRFVYKDKFLNHMDKPLNNITRDLLKRAYKSCKNRSYVFSRMGSSSRRFIEDKPYSRQAIYKILIQVYSGFYNEYGYKPVQFNLLTLKNMVTSSEHYYRLKKSVNCIYSGSNDGLISDVRSTEDSLYSSPESSFKKLCRDTISGMERGVAVFKCESILGYSRAEFIKHIDSFLGGDFFWSDRVKWQIDHIRPISDFIRKNELDVRKANCLSNLRVVSYSHNASKGSKF